MKWKLVRDQNGKKKINYPHFIFLCILHMGIFYLGTYASIHFFVGAKKSGVLAYYPLIFSLCPGLALPVSGLIQELRNK